MVWPFVDFPTPFVNHWSMFLQLIFPECAHRCRSGPLSYHSVFVDQTNNISMLFEKKTKQFVFPFVFPTKRPDDWPSKTCYMYWYHSTRTYYDHRTCIRSHKAHVQSNQGRGGWEVKPPKKQAGLGTRKPHQWCVPTNKIGIIVCDVFEHLNINF